MKAIILLSLVEARKDGKSAFTRIGQHAWLVLVAVVLIGCASKTKMLPIQPHSATEDRLVVAGNTLSRWVDRTSPMTSASAVPAAGEDCAVIYDPVQHRIILFGGKDDEDKNSNEMWALDLTTNTWQQITVEGESPPASEDHAVIYDPIGHRMILHGGEDGLTTNKTWAFDLKRHRWRNLTPQTEAPAREDHTAIFDSRGKRMVIFGGRDNDSTYDYINIHEIWAFDLDPDSPTFEKWKNLTPEDRHPLGRSDHVAVYDAKKNRMVIFGGWDKEEKEYLGDTWAFYFAALPDSLGYWRQIKTKKSHPPKRRHAVGVYDSARNWFIIVGGFGEEGYLNDVWAFDLTYDVWLNITPGPQPRIDHQAIYDPRSRSLILYGGDARLKGKFHDVWELQIQPGLPLELMIQQAGGKATQ
ncbi:MAG: hypothetical protein ONB44_09870 [candidate division KSB1 bacterium]|nr:hypothetical protein [candidate division KSB1 bacterium]MDZ7302433.1 hypothetical protein [candidate division KSB1 bacterium]MDZ7311635.1 hypothetical protein [candidate division KSB1 bacterium]